MKPTKKKAVIKKAIPVARKSCSTKKCGSKCHELDVLLQDEARHQLIKHVVKLAKFKDGKRWFKIPFVTTNRSLNTTIDLLEQSFSLKESDIKALSSLA